MACPHPPTTVVLGVSSYHFAGIDFVFWDQGTTEVAAPAVLAVLRGYPAPYQQEYPLFEVVDARPAIWPNELFGDSQGHLNPEGAQLFSGAVGRCLDRQPDMPDMAGSGSYPKLSDMPRSE